MSLSARILALLGSWLLAAMVGARIHAYMDAASEREAQLQAAESARETERLANRNTARVNDELTKNRLATARRTGDLERRLREQADASPGPAPGCPSRSDDTRAPVELLSDEARRNLVALTAEADAVADRLRALQQLERLHQD